MTSPIVKGGTVYILTNFYNAVLYVGVTSDLIKRVMEYQQKKFKNSFSAKYNVSKR